MGRGKRRIGTAVSACLLAVLVGIGIRLGNSYPAGAAAEAALVPDEAAAVTVWEDGSVVFDPGAAERVLIFYPGGRVEHTAYAPLLRSLAEEGWLCVLVKMPLDLAVLDADAAAGVAERFPQVEDWYVGGHSLGGAMAASYAAEHAAELEGLLLLAAYSTADLSDSGLAVWSVYGSEDTVLNGEKYARCRSNLPEDTREVVLEGGSHALFGDYGPQKGDGEAAITAMEQVALTVELLADP